MLTEKDLIARKEADASYHKALRELRLDHDRALVELTADVREGLIARETFDMRKQGITARYERDAARLKRQYGKDQS